VIKYRVEISEKCTACEECLKTCPTQSIYFGKGIFAIDPDSCDRTLICATVCPENAIMKVEDFRKKKKKSGVTSEEEEEEEE